MKRLKTLRFRFALWVSLLLVIVFLAFGVYVYGSLARGLFNTIDNSLATYASQIAAGLNIDNGQIILSDNLGESSEDFDYRQGFAVRVLTPEGRVVQEQGPRFTLPLISSQFFLNYSDPQSKTIIRVYNLPVEDNNQLVAIVQVAQSLKATQDTLRKLLLTLLVSIPLLVAVAGLSGYFLAARALSPIDQIISTARRISAEDLLERLPVPGIDDEIGRLTQTLNEMLARLSDSFLRERQFTSDASHELRTPLTAMQSILSTVRERRRTPEEYEQALDDLSDEVERLRTLVESLLRLARGEKYPLNFQEVNLSTLLTDVSDSLRPLAEIKNLSLHCETPANIKVWGDSDELIRLFVNLLDNAIKYTERGEIRVSVICNQKDVVIEISDTGVGIPAEHIPHIFDRFYRVEASRTFRGIGLGLAIAKEIVHAHHGEITVESKLGLGTTFTVILPCLHY